jgi:outer membrane protein assembly factor BamB
MNKTVVISVFILTVCVVLSVHLYNQANRFAVVNAGDGKVYKTDRATGETLLIYGMEEFQIQNENEDEIVTTEEKVLRLTKNSKTLNSGFYGLRNDSEIRSKIRDLQGDIRIDGW